MDDFKKILIMRLDRIGDVLLSTPALEAVRNAYPKSHIAVMVRPYVEEVVKGNPFVDELILYDKDALHRSVAGTLRFIGTLRARKFECAIVLHPSNRSHIIPFLAGIPVRVGYDRKLSFLLSRRIPHKKEFGLKHERDYTLDLLRYMGIEPASCVAHMPLNDSGERKAERLFKEHGIGPDSIAIVVHPGASCPSKRWPVERFAEVANRLAERHGAWTVVIAGEREREFGDRLTGLIRSRAVNMSGRASLGDLASILRRARLLVSNDSGPVHIASAVGTPVVAIFGRSDRGLSPRRWGPLGDANVVLHRYVGCTVCRAHRCEKGFECLRAISVADVESACELLLRTGKRAGQSQTC